MNGTSKAQYSVTFDPSVDTGSDGSQRDSFSGPVPKDSTRNESSKPRHNVIRSLLQQTIGENLEFASNAHQVHNFVTSVESYLSTSESLASLGKSLYTSKTVSFVMDEHMRIILWNDAAAELTGCTRDEMAGRNLLQDAQFMVPPATATFLSVAHARCIQGSSLPASVLDFKNRSGGKVTLMCTCTPLLANAAGPGMLVVAHDISHMPKSRASTPSITDRSNPLLDGAKTTMASSSNNHPTPEPAPPSVQSDNEAKVPGWGEIAPTYAIECMLGQGSYGQVIRCKHVATGELVAIKRIQNVFSDPVDAKRILRELCIVRQLRHPNIVQMREIIAPRDLDNFQDLFVVLEYSPSDLEKLLHSPQFLTAEHLRWLLLDLLKALKYMHSAEIVHRDLKPANVLLNLSPVAAKICDFGLARSLSTSTSGRKRKRESDGSTPNDKSLSCAGIHPRTPSNRIERQLTEHVVTRWYRAPEIIFRDHDYSAAIDVWSVGCIFAELLSMQKSSVPSHQQREPLFPGVSCFPLSPGGGQMLPQDSRDQLNTILDVLGTMDDEDIAEIADPDVQTYLRSLPKRPKRNLQEMYPGAEPSAIDLLTRMLQMNPRKRITLDEALNHAYLGSIRSLEEEIVAPKTIQLDFDEKKLNVNEIRKRMIDEIRFYHPSAGSDSTHERKKQRQA